MKDKKINFSSSILDITEKKRLDRQLRLPGWNQDLLKKSTILLVGVGGLGVEIAKNLAMVGIGHIILVDMDSIEYSNLNRQILFIGAKEGDSKALYAAKIIKEINPFVKVTAFKKALEEIDPVIYQQADLYIAGLDSLRARSELNRRAVHNNRILIDAGTSLYNGHMYCVFPYENACLACDPIREKEQEDLGACTLVGEPRKKSHCILKGRLKFESTHNGREPDIWNPEDMQYVQNYCNQLVKEYFPHEQPYSLDQIIQIIDHHEPTMITINAVMAGLQSQEAVKILHHLNTDAETEKLGSLNKGYIIYNGLTGKFFDLEKPKNSDCLVCGPHATPISKVKVKASYEIQKVVFKIAERKDLEIDADFVPTLFKIDNLAGMEEMPFTGTIHELGLRNYETILITGFENGESIYLQFNIV